MVEGGFTGYTLAARVKLEEDLQRVFLKYTYNKVRLFFPIKCYSFFYNFHDPRSIIHFVLYETS